MGWKEGIGTIAIMTFAAPLLITQVGSKIPGFMDDGIMLFTMLAWVVGAFAGRDVNIPFSKQIQENAELKRYMDVLTKQKASK